MTTPTKQPPKRGLICPHCKTGQLRTVTQTKKRTALPYTWRRRRCDNCGKTATTHERVGLPSYLSLVADTPNHEQQYVFNVAVAANALLKERQQKALANPRMAPLTPDEPQRLSMVMVEAVLEAVSAAELAARQARDERPEASE